MGTAFECGCGYTPSTTDVQSAWGAFENLHVLDDCRGVDGAETWGVMNPGGNPGRVWAPTSCFARRPLDPELGMVDIRVSRPPVVTGVEAIDDDDEG